VRTTAGLFSDFVMETDNRLCMHVRSSAVDWRLTYDQPEKGKEFTLEAILCRIPDLESMVSRSLRTVRYASINEMSYTDADGFLAKVQSDKFESFQTTYLNSGYEIERKGALSELRGNAETFARFMPQFMHTYINKLFDSIPTLHIVDPFTDSVRLSQLAITYVLSYFLGMLARYFPTHWIALQSGARGDGLWPTIHAAQEYIESSFPELTIEFIHDTLRPSEKQ
jgi:hypothetical protein